MAVAYVGDGWSVRLTVVQPVASSKRGFTYSATYLFAEYFRRLFLRLRSSIKTNMSEDLVYVEMS